ncbi:MULTISPECIES: hypothetical protein [unclassified Thioalkalivibrio]|uniref:hypothetical protein n=1 Tax=unclassified Thioalkalivibrio TaxID=2621013 RepID=UPI0003A25721|nr:MULTISPECIES: hypothetical protein [unclassified Thioalkalivibrio]
MSDDRVVDVVLDRMNKLDAKVDQMAEAITNLARVEERMSNGADRMNGHAREIKDLRERVQELEKLRWKAAGAMVLASALGGLLGAFGGLELIGRIGGAA